MRSRFLFDDIGKNDFCMNLRQRIDRLFPDKSPSNLHADYHGSLLLVIAFCVSCGVICMCRNRVGRILRSDFSVIR